MSREAAEAAIRSLSSVAESGYNPDPIRIQAITSLASYVYHEEAVRTLARLAESGYNSKAVRKAAAAAMSKT
jgi:hypothetical protein